MLKRNWRIIAIIGTFLLICMMFATMCAQNTKYNNELHTLQFGPSMVESGQIYDKNIAIRLCVRGYDTNEYAAWLYEIQNEDESAPFEERMAIGAIYELYVKNLSEYTVVDWEADIYFPEQVNLNSGWNGDFIVHQHVLANEKVHTFAEGKFDMNELKLDYSFDGVCLLIALDEGDYITYIPSAESQEVPLSGIDSSNGDSIEKKIGFITYTYGTDTTKLINFETGCVRYKMYRELWKEPSFIPFVIAAFLWIIVCVSSLAIFIKLRRLRKQNELLARENEKVRAENRQFIMDLEAAKAEADRANKAKTDFLFNMSHDIRTPMNAIMGFTDLLEKNVDDKEKVNSYLGKIKRSSEFLLSLINNVLEMARVESGNVVLEERLHKSGEILNSLNEIFDERMAVKKIKYSSSIDVKTQYFYADTLKVNEIFLNLLSNAYKYTPEGGSISFDVKETASDKEGYTVIESVISDTGIGMSKEFLPHLFDEFSRETGTTEKVIEGTGLGMPIVKKLVDLMGGTISVESELGKGTTFKVILTHRIGTVEETGKQTGIISVEPVELSGKHVILAEDNDLNAEIAMEILGEDGTGFIIDRAEDGQACVEMLAAAPENYYDLILMDVQMPRMNGYEATRAIRAMEGTSKKDILIIAMTANAFEEDKRNALEAGMDAHITKPIVVSVLIDTITRELARKQHI